MWTGRVCGGSKEKVNLRMSKVESNPEKVTEE